MGQKKNKMPKFQYGDRVRVKTNGTYKNGKVVSIRKTMSGSFICTVDFDSPPTLIPQSCDYPEDFLELIPSMLDSTNNRQKYWFDKSKCPICYEKWNVMESPISGKKQIWEDCLKCKKTKEQIVKERE